jgi:hypothetical protein
VADILGRPLLPPGPARDALLAAGIRAAQSTPVRTGAATRAFGAVSTYATRAGEPLSPSAAAAMDRLASELAQWLRWYQRNVVLDTLEYLHLLARSPAAHLQQGPAGGRAHASDDRCAAPDGG